MKRAGQFLILLSFLLVLNACEKDDVEYNFFNNTYQGTIIYPDGTEFPVSTISFKAGETFYIKITVPPSAVEKEEDRYKYITSVSGKYEYSRENNKTVNLTLNSTATVAYGTLRDEKSEITVGLNEIFPIHFVLKINRDNDKIKDKIYSEENSSGLTIIGD